MMRRPLNMKISTLQHLITVANDMREEERDQYVATFHRAYSASDAACFCWQLPGPKFTVFHEDRPCAAGGAAYTGSGEWEMWMIGTSDGWSHQAKALTRAAKWLVETLLEDTGARKIITHSLTNRNRAMHWFERSLGMKCDSVDAGVACYVRAV